MQPGMGDLPRSVEPRSVTLCREETRSLVHASLWLGEHPKWLDTHSTRASRRAGIVASTDPLPQPHVKKSKITICHIKSVC